MGRITGLDPAGPRCFDGPILSAIPKLHSEILCLESAAFVHVIHNNGGLEPVTQVQFQDLKLYSSLVTSIFYPGEGLFTRDACLVLKLYRREPVAMCVCEVLWSFAIRSKLRITQ